jgi:aryl-alcohol dehydrogenase-like predicted oxidoreductase
VSLLPYSPLAGGVLSGKYLDGAQRPDGARFSQISGDAGANGSLTWRSVLPDPARWNRRRGCWPLRKKRALSPVTLATAWSKQNDFVASTIVGVSREDQLDEILAAMDLKLSAEVMGAIHKVTREILYPMG